MVPSSADFSHRRRSAAALARTGSLRAVAAGPPAAAAAACPGAEPLRLGALIEPVHQAIRALRLAYQVAVATHLMPALRDEPVAELDRDDERPAGPRAECAIGGLSATNRGPGDLPGRAPLAP